MRLLYTAVAAACLITPAVATAQSSPGALLSTYNVSGCGQGIIASSPSGAVTFGQVFCVTGSASLYDAGAIPSGGYNYRVQGTLSALFNPAYTGTGAGDDTRGGLSLFYRNASCPTGCTGSGLLPILMFTVGGPSQPFSSTITTSAPIDGASARLTTGDLGALNLYGIPNFPGYGSGSPPQTIVPITFTATPEPTSLALVALGGLAVTGLGICRRRVDA